MRLPDIMVLESTADVACFCEISNWSHKWVYRGLSSGCFTVHSMSLTTLADEKVSDRQFFELTCRS